MPTFPTRKQLEITVSELASQLGIKFQGEADLTLHAVASFTKATPADLCFLKSLSYLDDLLESACLAVIVPLNFERTVPGKTLLYSANPHLSFVEAIQLFNLDRKQLQTASIHPTASVADSAQLGNNVSIGAYSVIGEGVYLGDGVQIASGCVIEDEVSIGRNSVLMANVTLCYETVIGENAIFQPGVVVGSDGFGLVYNAGNWVRIPHLGKVIIGDQVEIGANTTVDRGALDDTVIADGVKLDNLIQIGHNVRIGENTAVAGCVAIAGSVVIGRNCKISGGCSIVGHLNIVDNVTVTAMTLVTKCIKTSGTYSSGTPIMGNRLWHRTNARYKSLDKMFKTLADLQKNNE